MKESLQITNFKKQMNTTKPRKVTQSFYLLIDQYPSSVVFLDLLWFVMKSMQNWPETQHSQELNSSICSNHCLSRHTALTPPPGMHRNLSWDLVFLQAFLCFCGSPTPCFAGTSEFDQDKMHQEALWPVAGVDMASRGIIARLDPQTPEF